MQIDRPVDEMKEKSQVKSSQIFYTFADEDMAQFFIQLIKQQELEQGEDAEQKLNANKNQQAFKQIIEEQPVDQKQGNEPKQQHLEENQNKSGHVSRLQIQIQKNNLQLIPVYGEIFIKLIQCQLISDRKIQSGLLLLTNYRIAFFKLSKKKIDLPFGFIDHVQINLKNKQCNLYLKHNHCWKFRILKQSALKEFQVFLTIYLKSENIKSNFAFAYGSKCPVEHLHREGLVETEFVRLGIDQNPSYRKIMNSDFEISLTYPQNLFVPKDFDKKVQKLAKFWNYNRFPVLVYAYKPHFGEGGSIWRSSYISADRNQDLSYISKYLEGIKRNSQYLHIFDCSQKQSTKKTIDENQLYPHCIIKNLQLSPLLAIKNSYLLTIQCFLTKKKGFIRDLLSSKWYDDVLSILKGAGSIVNCVLMGSNCIIKEKDGRERSCQISALSQLILTPEYRTFKGFSILVQKEFQYFGYPFSTRFGMKSQKDQTIPMFIQFLDCVSQLFNQNPLSFQFNYKFLSKLSNLMYTSLFGTFLGESERERKQAGVYQETASIWNQLHSQLTQNPYYQQKQGLLSIPSNYNQIRVWKEHFWYLTTPPKQSYKINPLAEDNHDYKNLACLQIRRDNTALREQITVQRKKIQQLRTQIEQKKGKKQ